MAVTRNDVARLAGVSPAVVSYVLNGGSRPVAEKTRLRVEEAIRALGYRRDGMARSLRTGTTRTLGFVLPDSINPFFAELSRAVENAAFDRGYAVFVCNAADDSERERSYLESLAERRIDGLVFVSEGARQDFTDLRSIGIPVVVLDRLPSAAPVSSVQTNNMNGAYVGASHLFSHGYETVAFLGGEDATVSGARRRGWEAATVESAYDPGPASTAPFSYEGGYAAASELFGAPETRPRAVLACSDVQAIGLLRGLADLGLAVPDDVAIVSVDGTLAGRYSSPPLTTIAQPIAEMGAQAVAALLDSPADVRHILLDDVLILRQSCGCP